MVGGCARGCRGEERGITSRLLRYSSLRQCYFEMKTILAPHFSVLSFKILWFKVNLTVSVILSNSYFFFFFRSKIWTDWCWVPPAQWPAAKSGPLTPAWDRTHSRCPTPSSQRQCRSSFRWDRDTSKYHDATEIRRLLKLWELAIDWLY